MIHFTIFQNMSNVAGLKDVHGLQLALHLPEIRRQIFDSVDTDDMKGDDG